MAGPADFTVYGPIARGDLPGLCARICRLFSENPATELLCDVRTIEPDAVTVDALARLQLAAQRNGRTVRLHHASSELVELVDFLGLRSVLVLERQAEQREQPLRVEEEREANDLAARDVEHL
jgi:ABC-type transporter Mla MlaB component